MRTFVLQRDKDISGISGTGLVAEGVEWADGTVALRWLTEDLATTVIHRSIETVERLHCHQGSSRIEWTGWPPIGLPPFIDELRAARKVIEALRPEHRTRGKLGYHAPTCDCPLCKALAAYDEAVAS